MDWRTVCRQELQWRRRWIQIRRLYLVWLFVWLHCYTWKINESIVFGCKVVNIAYSELYSAVTCKDGIVFGNATEIILTVPISILQENDIDFTPNLPADYIKAIKAPSFPAGIKIFSKCFRTFLSRGLFSSGRLRRVFVVRIGPILFRLNQWTNTFTRGISLGGIFVWNPGDKRDQTDADLIESTLAELDEIFDGAATASFQGGRIRLKALLLHWA